MKRSLLLGVAALLLLAACQAPGGEPPAPKFGPLTQVTADRAQAASKAILEQLRLHGYDATAGDQRLGGLYVDWSADGTAADFTGTNPNCRIGRVGQTCAQAARQDPALDLAYLHALWRYEDSHRGEGLYAPDLALYGAIVKQDFAKPVFSMQGSIYFQMLDVFVWSGDRWYFDTAQAQASYWYDSYYHAPVGAIYSTDSDPQGSYSPADVVEIAAALIAAARYPGGKSQWSDAGHSAIFFVYSYGYLSQLAAFPTHVFGLLGSDGNAAACPKISPEIRPEDQARAASALLRVYSAGGEEMMVKNAQDLLDALYPGKDKLGLWDKNGLGYATSAHLSGTTLCKPGKALAGDLSKDLAAFSLIDSYYRADQFARGRYSPPAGILIQALLERALAGRQGLPAQLADNWGVPSSEPADLVSAANTLIAWEGLQWMLAPDRGQPTVQPPTPIATPTPAPRPTTRATPLPVTTATPTPASSATPSPLPSNIIIYVPTPAPGGPVFPSPTPSAASTPVPGASGSPKPSPSPTR